MAVVGHAAGDNLTQLRARPLQQILARGDREHDFILLQHELGPGEEVVLVLAQRGDVHARGERRGHLGEPLAGGRRVADRDLESLQAGGRSFDARLQHQEGEIEEQDRAGNADGIGHRVAHRRVVGMQRLDRRLQRGRAGAGAGEHAERVAELEVAAHERKRYSRREQHADQREQVGLAPLAARQPAEELAAVLDADRVEEEREPQDPHRRGGHRFRPNQPTASATNSTAPTPSESPLRLIWPAR